LINGAYSELDGRIKDTDLYIIFNASPISRFFAIPGAPSGKGWRVAVDTSNPYPDDIFTTGEEPRLPDERYFVKKLSTVVLLARD